MRGGEEGRARRRTRGEAWAARENRRVGNPGGKISAGKDHPAGSHVLWAGRPQRAGADAPGHAGRRRDALPGPDVAAVNRLTAGPHRRKRGKLFDGPPPGRERELCPGRKEPPARKTRPALSFSGRPGKAGAQGKLRLRRNLPRGGSGGRHCRCGRRCARRIALSRAVVPCAAALKTAPDTRPQGRGSGRALPRR